ncbi:MAG TPA: hypothetical protein VMV44_04235 [Rectinemataceae bacterium]|nr:hypothetical protein [Rectinemataceae bacterium]
MAVPSADSSTTYFTGSASLPGRDLAKADEAATADLVASIMRYVGAKVTVESTAIAKATVDSYQTDITQSVKTAADNRVAGFSIKDRYVAWDPKSGRSTVYILAGYRTADLEAEKRRIAAVFAEKSDAVAVPEAQGDAFRAQGRNWDALGRYISAAVAASGSGIDNADIKLRRNLDKALSTVATLQVSIVPPSGKALVGLPWPGAFTIRVSNGGTGSAVAGAALLLSYPRKQGSRIVQRRVSATTDSMGSASFTPPPPDFVGKGRFAASVDFSLWSNQLDSLPPAMADSAASLREAFASASAEVGVEVQSQAATIPIGVALVDEGSDGKLLDQNTAAAALVDALSQAGFQVSSLSLDAALVAKGDDGALRQAAAALGSSAQRLVYGEARLLSSRDDGDMWMASVRISAKAVEIAGGRLLWSGEREASGVGSDEAAAIRAAFRAAGASALGKDLISSLP